jgi:hypothetical protein
MGTIDPMRHVLPGNQNDEEDDDNNEEFFKKELELATLIDDMMKRHEMREKLKKQKGGLKPNSYASISMWKKYFHIKSIESEDIRTIYEDVVKDLAQQPIQTQYAKEQANILHRTRFAIQSSSTTTPSQSPFGSTMPPFVTTPPPTIPAAFNSGAPNPNYSNHVNENTNTNSSSSVDYQNLTQLHEQRVLYQPNLSVGPDSVYLAQ